MQPSMRRARNTPPDYSGGQYDQQAQNIYPNLGYPPNPGAGSWQHPQDMGGYPSSGGLPPQGDPAPYGGLPPQQQQQQMNYGQFANDQMAAMAMQYTQVLAGQGKDIVHQKMGKYVTYFSQLKYYFAVDTAYVAKKLALLFFPFTHQDWGVHFNEDQPVAPRYEVNAPDLYIPCMAFVTYILTAGYLLGLKDQFSPEQLGKQASSAFGWVFLEVLLILLTHYLCSLSTSTLKLLDIISFCAYKFVTMIAALLGNLLFGSLLYYVILIYSACSLGFFLMRTMRVAILTKQNAEFGGGNKRATYLVVLVCLVQPIMMYWLTYHLVDLKVVSSPTLVERPLSP